ncbi:MAG: DUF1080 domain-containing protein [Kiritimatiellae bacterium]|nr:DUF1080 domain-containing protein [Kiritimatiellia bacterium]
MAINLFIVAAALLYGDAPDDKHAWAVHDWVRPKPVKVEPAAYVPTLPPSDAIVLFDGSRESFEKNWCDAKGAKSGWSYSDEGYFYSVPKWKNGGNIYTREQFGDCQLHIEYRHDPNQLYTDKGPQMRGNSGVFLMGTKDGYEVQVLESYYTSQQSAGTSEFVDNYTDGQAGAVYAENPPLVNPQRKPGEWQVYDIIFHQPVWSGDKLLHPGSITVFFNGVLVQDAWEMEGATTHCTRRPLKPGPTKGPLAFQDHGCVVQFRNIWYRPIASRWANLTHSQMSADKASVMELRRKTAAKLFAAIADPSSVSAENLLLLGHVVQYSYEGEYKAAFDKCLEAYRKAKGDSKELEKVNGALKVLVRAGIIDSSKLIK